MHRVRGIKAPKTKLQTPEKLQFTSSKAGDVTGRIGIWSLGFHWCLELGCWCFHHGVWISVFRPVAPSDSLQGVSLGAWKILSSPKQAVALSRRCNENFCRTNFPGRLLAVEGLDCFGKSKQDYL